MAIKFIAVFQYKCIHLVIISMILNFLSDGERRQCPYFNQSIKVDEVPGT